MKKENNSLFRQKQFNTATGPEQLDRYLKVTSISAWLVVAAETLVVAAIFIWVFAGKIRTVANGAGVCRDGRLVIYFAQSDAEKIDVGDIIYVSDEDEFKVCDVNTDILRAKDVPGNVAILLPKVSWYSTVEADAALDDGFYKVEYYGEEISPITFIMEPDTVR